jgi:hypothetical protein
MASNPDMLAANPRLGISPTLVEIKIHGVYGLLKDFVVVISRLCTRSRKNNDKQ